MSCEFHFHKQDYSSMLDVVMEYGSSRGFKVILYGETHSSKTAGTIKYDERLIIINRALCCSGCWLMTILHELGHMMHFLDSGSLEEAQFLKEFPDKDKREKTANVLGKKISNELKFMLDKEWDYMEFEM